MAKVDACPQTAIVDPTGSSNLAFFQVNLAGLDPDAASRSGSFVKDGKSLNPKRTCSLNTQNRLAAVFEDEGRPLALKAKTAAQNQGGVQFDRVRPELEQLPVRQFIDLLLQWGHGGLFLLALRKNPFIWPTAEM